jgi:hypothetical protein
MFLEMPANPFEFVFCIHSGGGLREEWPNGGGLDFSRSAGGPLKG